MKWIGDSLICVVLDRLNNRIEEYSLAANGIWVLHALDALAFMGQCDIETRNDSEPSSYYIKVEDFITPPTVYLKKINTDPTLVRVAESFFRLDNIAMVRLYCRSKDGTSVPYVMVGRTDCVGSSRPTIISTYGGFGNIQLPFYSPELGACWLRKGGVFVLSNIRGGGELGEEWHFAATRENRGKSIDDLRAIVEDIIERKTASPEKIGIIGESHGGFIAANCIIRLSGLIKAVICDHPLTDMRRYVHLHSGYLWKEEYGDPDSANDWEYMKEFSPYSLIAPRMEYPEVLFITASYDDRVHPAHARKMAYKMQHFGYSSLFYESPLGNHSSSFSMEERINIETMIYAFFAKELGLRISNDSDFQ